MSYIELISDIADRRISPRTTLSWARGAAARGMGPTLSHGIEFRERSGWQLICAALRARTHRQQRSSSWVKVGTAHSRRAGARWNYHRANGRSTVEAGRSTARAGDGGATTYYCA